MIRSGKNAKVKSINMLKEIIEGTSLTDTEKAFEKRQEIGTTEKKLNSKFFKRMIAKIDEEAKDWSAMEIRDLFIKNYKKAFWEEIQSRNMNQYAKEWHKSIKKLTNYGSKSQILNLQNGPVAKRSEWKEKQEGKRNNEDITILTNQEDIQKEQEEWVIDTCQP